MSYDLQMWLIKMRLGVMFCLISFIIADVVPLLAIADSPSASPKKISIGVVLPLTGNASFWGESSKNAIQLAVEDVNESGGINGARLQIIIEDERCDPKAAVSALQKLITVDKVTAIVGPICSSSTLAVAPIAEKKKTVLISPCSEADAITSAGDYIFRTWPAGGGQAKGLALYAKNKLGLRRAAVISINNDFGLSLSQTFIREFVKAGGTITVNESYDEKDLDLKSQLLKIKASKPEAVFLSSYTPDGLVVVRQMKQLGISSLILGTSAVNNQDFFKPLGKLVEGMYLSDLPDSTSSKFRTRYATTFGVPWPGNSSCASVAYDDVLLIASAFRERGIDSEEVRSYLNSVKDFPGASGPITFDKYGDLIRSHSVYKVEQGKVVKAD